MDEFLNKRGVAQKSTSLDDDRTAIKSLINSLLAKDNNRVALAYSPDRYYPSFSTGPATVAKELGSIWAKARGGAALVSATLWLPSWEGVLKVDYMRKVLSLPLGRVDQPSPVIWDEIFSAPTRYLPSKEISRGLIPPEQSGKGMEDWCRNQAKEISSFNKTSKGGTIVLCTSYAQVRVLLPALIEHGIDKQRIVENSGRLATDKADFTAKYQQGLKPLWLALGPAWTGLDLQHGDADNDYLLADLIISRIPIGLNKSVTSDARASLNFNVNTYEALLRLKQGLGRLIRRGGLKHRRLFILDGRVTCESSFNSTFMKQLVSDVYLLIGGYKNKVIWAGKGGAYDGAPVIVG